MYPDGGHAASDNIKHPTPVNRWILSFPIKQPLLSILQPQKNGTCSSCPAPPASLLVVLPLLVPPPPRGGVTDSALYLQTFSHFVIVNKTCLSLPPPPPGMLRPRSLARLRLGSCSVSFSPLFWPSEHDAWNRPHASRISSPHPRPRTRPCGPSHLLSIHAHARARAAPPPR